MLRLKFGTCQYIKERGKNEDEYLTSVTPTVCIVLMLRNTYRAITISLVLFTPAKTAGNLTQGHVHRSIHFLWSPLNFSTCEFRSRPGQVLTGALLRFLSLKENSHETPALLWRGCCMLKALASL